MQVAEFVTQCVERWGGAVADREPGVLEVLLPAELETAFGGGVIAVADDPARLRPDERGELATPGSPFVDQLIALASARGTVATTRLPAGRLRRGGLRQEVERTLLFSNCRVRHEAAEPVVLDSPYAQFNFRVTYLSDEKRERVHVIPVDLWSMRANLLLAERLRGPAGPLEETRHAEAESGTVEQAYGTAQAALRAIVTAEAALHRQRIEKRFGIEFARVVDYFDQMAQELSARQRDAQADGTRALETKLEAAAAERERKLHELGEKHQLRVRARLVSARLLVQAKTFFTLLIDRGPTTRRLTLCWDSLLERLEPPACEGCGSETTRLHVDARARMLCPGCANGGPGAAGEVPRAG